MIRQRPTVIMILALLNLLFGAACILFGCATVSSRFLVFALHTYAPPPAPPPYALGAFAAQGSPPPVPPDIVTYVHEQLPSSTVVDLATAASVMLGGMILILSSLGLLRMHRWARWLAAAYSLITVVWQLAFAFFRVAVVLPVAESYFPTFSDPNYWGTAIHIDVGDVYGFRMGFCLLLGLQLSILVGHALAQLAILFLPHVNAAFAGRDLTEYEKQ